jgi:SAM-dependent methyltransferase
VNDLAALYRHRFEEASLERKRDIWRVLCARFFQRYVAADGVVLDLASGYGEFINNIVAKEKVAVDINPDAPRFLDPGIRFHALPATDLGAIEPASIDTVFTSNFFEHLPDKGALRQVFAEVHRILRPAGRFLAMGPNIRYVGGAYWDFFDHHLPLTHESVAEGLAISGFEVERVIDRFLPYTTRSRLPQHPALVALYLKVPLAWRILGSQFFVVARKAGH